MSRSLIYVTAASRDEAAAIGRKLVEERLCACANVIDGVASFYWWEGAVREDAEAVLIAKTREDLVAVVTERIKELHSYDCPCVVALPITAGNRDFLQWIDRQTSAAGD
ncbi:MAG TPA: divalent-cation tolerance protein CutA [Alphaproteobacteria bacterium]|nr:divalent-cation tolerance protein CutA [Alphaproteobacteria bacterium]